MTRIVINKAQRQLAVSSPAGLMGTYAVVLGKNWAADKCVEGDLATPEGEFYVCAKNPRSKYFLSLCLSYPNVDDAARGLRTNLITSAEHAQILLAIEAGRMPPQHTSLGGEIYIHGHGTQVDDGTDWTHGCIALRDADMQVVYDAASIGTPVVILGR